MCGEGEEGWRGAGRTSSVDSLMYIKEDLILPQDVTFYNLIVTKARGKSGPLFHFDVHEDVRTINDASVEKDESHAGEPPALSRRLVFARQSSTREGRKVPNYIRYQPVRLKRVTGRSSQGLLCALPSGE